MLMDTNVTDVDTNGFLDKASLFQSAVLNASLPTGTYPRKNASNQESSWCYKV